MSHHIYHTEGLVLSGYNTGEANKYVAVFTRELGLVRAVVQGIRKGTSRLRYALQNYSLARVDFVRGRDVWRITSATPMTLFDAGLHDPDKARVVARVTALLERLCPGEEENEAFFAEVLTGLQTLEYMDASEEALLNFEAVFVAKILYHLGYWKEEKETDEFIILPMRDSLAGGFVSGRRRVVDRINESLKESHL